MASAIMLHTFRVPLVLTRVPLRRMTIGAAASVAIAMGGCAGAPPSSGETTPVEEARDSEAEREAREREAAQQARLRELEAQLALARSEAEELRARSGAQVQTETVRIGGEDASDAASLFDDTDTGEWEVPAEHLPPAEEEPGPSAQRPVLRLYGERPLEEPPPLDDPSFASVANLPVADLPESDPSLRLTTAPTTSGDAGAPPWIASAPPPQAAEPPGRPTVDPGREAYERALGLFRERKVGQAARELQRLLSSHPGHALASRARYWLAESLYIQRRYDDARETFEAYVQSSPRSAKVPDALLKIGLCHRRSGDDAAASRVFARLRNEHPDSVAARTAAGSGS